MKLGIVGSNFISDWLIEAAGQEMCIRDRADTMRVHGACRPS